MHVITDNKGNTMIELKNIEDKEKLTDGNLVRGSFPQLKNSKIIFRGKGNVLFCKDGVTIEDSVLDFNSNNGLIYLGKSKFSFKLNATVNENCTLAFGQDNYINGPIRLLLSEHKNVFIGSNCIFSTDINFRNADAHLIYDIETMKRINNTKSIFLGDHVWVGKSAFIAKGTRVSSGSIIGANSLISNKTVEHNASYGGNPARKIKEGVFWNGCCVHQWDDVKTQNSQDYNKFIETYFKDESVDRWIYSYDDGENVLWDDIDAALDSPDIFGRVLYLNELYNNNKKNRFCNN